MARTVPIMSGPPELPLSYEMRERTTWRTYAMGAIFLWAGPVIVLSGGARLLPVTIPCVVAFAAGALALHLREIGRLLLRADGRGIELTTSALFVAWPDVLHADLGYSGEDRALLIRVVAGSVVPLSERGERTARRLNGPRRRRGRPDPHAELSVSRPYLLDRRALSAVIRAHAPHVTGRFGAG